MFVSACNVDRISESARDKMAGARAFCAAGDSTGAVAPVKSLMLSKLTAGFPDWPPPPPPPPHAAKCENRHG